MIVPRKMLSGNANWFALVLTAALLVAPFLIAEQFVAALVMAAIYTVMTTGLNLFMGYTGQISFGHNSFAAIGAYGCAVFTIDMGMPPLLAVVLAALLTGVVAFLVGYPTLRLRGHYLAMATLALGLMTVEILTQWKSVTQGMFGISGIPPLGIGPWELSDDLSYYFVYWGIAGIVIWMVHRIFRSRLGFALRAVSGDEAAAQSLGIDIARYKLIAFILSAMIISLAGSMFALFISFISPDVFGLYMVILLFTMLFVGGVNTKFGPMLGAIVITILPETLRSFNSAREFIYATLLLLILIFAPRGLAGIRELLARLAARRGGAGAINHEVSQ